MKKVGGRDWVRFVNWRMGLPLALALLVSLPATGVGASPNPQSSAPRDSRAEDQEGDVKVFAGGQSVSPPGNSFDHLDLKAAWLGRETDQTIEVGATVKVNDPTVPQVVFLQRYLFLYFTRGDPASKDAVRYRVMIAPWFCEEGKNAQLQALDAGRGWYRTRKCLASEYDATSVSYGVVLEKNDVVDSNHIPLRYADELQEIWALSWTSLTTGSGSFTGQNVNQLYSSVYDRTPDDQYMTPFQAVLGYTGQGHLALTAEESVRVSNGESTTIVYRARLNNANDRDDTVFLNVLENQGHDWDVRVPARLVVPAKKSVDFPVILSMGFSHTHGQTWTFKVKAESASDPQAWTTQEFGVFFTDVPQPSEHHQGLLYLHSGPLDPQNNNPFNTLFTTVFDFKQSWMNPSEEDTDPTTTDGAIPSYFNEGLIGGLFMGVGRGQPPDPSRNIARWEFPLSPALLIGLDFDVTQQASLIVKVKSSVPAQRAVVKADLLYCDPSDKNGTAMNWYCPAGTMRSLAKGDSAPVVFSGGDQREFNIPMQVNKSADVLRYQRGANLLLQVFLQTDTPQNLLSPEPKPLLYPKGSLLYLPLLEYHDPVGQSFQDVGSLLLEPLGPFEKPVNPDRTAVFPFRLTNGANQMQKVQLEVAGYNKDWAGFAEGPDLALDPHEARELNLAVHPPTTAQPTERAELFAVVQSANDPNIVAVARLRAVVVDPAVQDIPDEAGKLELQQAGQSPGFEAGLVVLSALGLAIAGRRRH